MSVSERLHNLDMDRLLAQVSADPSHIHVSNQVGLEVCLADMLKTAQQYSLIPSSDGAVSIVENKGKARDYSSNGAMFEAHTDGLYYDQPPQFGLLYCIRTGLIQVPTFFIDTTVLVRILSEREPDALAVLRKVDQVFIARGGNEHRRPVIEINPLSGEEVMNITLGRSYLRPAAITQATREPHLHEMVDAFHKLLNWLPAATTITHEWSKGDLLVWDNHRFIHGRGDASSSRGRSLMRAWLSPKL